MCSLLPPPCPCTLLRKSFRWELLLCLLPLSIHDTSKVSPSAYPQGLAFLWLMVYVFHSSLKHKRLISLPCGGQERETGKTTLRKNVLYFSTLFIFFQGSTFTCCLRLFGTLALAGLACVNYWTLLCNDTAAAGSGKGEIWSHLIETSWFANAQPPTVGEWKADWSK